MIVEGRFALPDLVRTRVERRASTFDADHRNELPRLEIDEQRLGQVVEANVGDGPLTP